MTGVHFSSNHKEVKRQWESKIMGNKKGTFLFPTVLPQEMKAFN